MENTNIKDNIITFRKRMGLTQKELSEKIHYSDKVISKWECGESYPDVIALKKLSDFFNVSIDDMMGTSIVLDKTPKLPDSAKLKVVKTVQPSLVAKLWIIIPFIGLIVSIFYGIEIFLIVLIICGVLMVFYGLTNAHYEFEAYYLEHSIRVVNKIKSCELYIDNLLVDGKYGIFQINPSLSGKIGHIRIKVNVYNMTSFDCVMFVEA